MASPKEQAEEFFDELQRQADELRREVGRLIPLAAEVIWQYEAQNTEDDNKT